jgi:hypothetical protein
MNYLHRRNDRGGGRSRGRYHDRGNYRNRSFYNSQASSTPPFQRGRGRDRGRGRGRDSFQFDPKRYPAIFKAKCHICNWYGHSRRFCKFIHKYHPEKAAEYNRQGNQNSDNGHSKAQMNISQATTPTQHTSNTPTTNNSTTNNNNDTTSIAPPNRANSAPYSSPTMKDFFPNHQ